MTFKTGAAIAAVFLSLAPMAAPVNAAGKPAVSKGEAASFQAIMTQGFDKLKSRDYQSAKESFEAALNHPVFERLPPELQYHLYVLAAFAEEYSDDADKAYQHMIDAGTVAPDARDGRYWTTFCDVAQRAHKSEALADAFVRIVTQYPDTLKNLDSGFVGQAIHEIRKIKDDHAHLLTVLEALHAAKYRPSNVFWTGEWVDYQRMAIYAEKGDQVQARAIAATLVEPGHIMAMQIDRRYSGFVTPDIGAYSAATDKDIVRLEGLVAAHPEKLAGVQALASALMTANRLPEALRRVDDALAKVAAAPKDKPAFDDLDDQLNWAYDTRARVLKKMGRFDDALAALKQGRDVAQAAGNDVVSQKINLSDELNAAGHPKEALEEIKTFDPKGASPYGVMSASEARACAYAQLGDTDHVKAEIEYMKAHAKDRPGPLQSALLCAGDLDALAGETIGQLDDPDERNAALIDVQTYLLPAQMTAWQKTMHDRYIALLKRPDVKSAIDKYGFVRSYPGFGPEI